MIRLFLILSFFVSGSFAEEPPKGFLWYNLPKIETPLKKPKGTPFNQLNFTDRDAVLRFYTLEALHKARSTHDVKDMYHFLKLQQYWLKESSAFKNVFEKVLLMNPEMDYSASHPVSQSGIQLEDDVKSKKEDLLLESSSQSFGLIFFYRGDNPFDTKEAPILKDFSARYHFKVLPVSVDGTKTPLFPHSKMDKGEAQALNINYFPAILLVNPKTKKTTPIAFGLTTQDVLKAHLINVLTAYQGVNV